MSSLTLCCTPNLLAPPPLNNSFVCCSVLTPTGQVQPSNSSTTCSNVDCSSYTPVCFSVTGSNLCNYLQGIDTAICNLTTSIANITCSQITMTGNYTCIFPPTVGQTGMNLCTWSQQVNTLFCNIFKVLQGGGTSGFPSTGTINQNTVNSNLVTDGGSGTLTTTTGVSSTNGTVSLTSATTHGTALNNVMVTSTNPILSATLTTTTNIYTIANKTYELKAFVYVSGSSPASASIGITVNGTGTQRQIQTINTSTQSGWQQVITQFTPNVNQNVTITLGGSGFTSGSLVFADLTMQNIPAINSGGYYEFQLPYIDDIGKTYNNIASNFASVLNYSTSGLFITVGSDTLVMNGKTIYTTQQTIGFPAASTYYVFYDSWTDSYLYKASNVTDATQLLIYTIVTNGSVVTSKTISCPVAPISGNNIQALSITGANIANATITASKLVNSGVAAGNYGDSSNSTHSLYATVNAQGLLTGLSAVPINFPVTSVNSLTGAVSLGLSNMNDVTITTPSSGQFLKYNGSKWINASITANYYQTVYAGLVAQTQQPGLNFVTAFTLTNDNVNSVTTISLATNGIIYSKIQQASANTILGNPTGSTANFQEISLVSSLSFQSNQLGVAFAFNSQSGASYNVVSGDMTGFAVIGMSNSGARTVTLLAANTVPVGVPIEVKDTNGNAGANNITVNVSGGGNIDGSATNVISTNYGKQKYVSNGTQYYTI